MKCFVIQSLDLVSCTVMDSQTFATADELRTTLLQATEELGFEHVLQVSLSIHVELLILATCLGFCFYSFTLVIYSCV
jgi:hypothetical protein